jgi:predicted urease superfamily metal-dependent hydrolase
MTKQHKLVTLSAVLPVLADFIDDLNEQYVFKQDLKRKANILVEEIRKVDSKVLQVYGENREEIYKQQIELQLIFRQWILETIKFD